MQWTVLVSEEFQPEFFALPLEVRREVSAITELLEQFGPQLGDRTSIRSKIPAIPT